MSSSSSGRADDWLALWPETVRAHFALAGHIASAALVLEFAATLCDADGDWLYRELAELLPAEDEATAAPVLSDRDFLLDRADTHREKANVFGANGSALAAAMASDLRNEAGAPDSWDRRDELLKALRPYAEAIGAAARDAEQVLAALDSAVPRGGGPSPADEMTGVVRFLNEEAALLARLVGD